MTDAVQGRFDLIPTHLAMAAMRDNGYKNTAYALAELIDNAIQAGGRDVEVLCSEREEQLPQRARRRIDQIGVIDNGSGMDSTTLRMALQFGNGTRLDDRSGMGRFGMGLPNASISQCRRVDVWTWRSGITSAIHTYIDLDEVREGAANEVPEPVPSEPPVLWLRAAASPVGSSGTLVVWSDLDRCMWRTARTIIEHSGFLVGRMYRRFIHDGRAAIRLAAFLKRDPVDAYIDRLAEVNDPIYRMTPSSTPAPFTAESMFEPYGDDGEYRHAFTANGARHEAVVRFTVASEQARQRSESGADAGRQPHGKHAARNVGVSVVRADREIELSQALVDPSEPRDRWWGIEIDFPPELDELFGVTNNKQSARTLSDMLDTPLETLLEPNQSPQQLYDELQEANDPRHDLIRFTEEIRKTLGLMRSQIQTQMKGQTRRRRHTGNSAEVRGTTATTNRKDEGHHGASDADESLPEEQRVLELEGGLEDVGVPAQQAHEEAAEAIQSGLKYRFAEADLDSPAFFSVTPRGGVIIITLNTRHPVHEHLIEVLELDDHAGSAEDRLENAREGLRLLLEAWARYEDEQPEGPRRDSAMDARSDWGRVARQFFSV
ncbi:MAG: ATP-binding protein [Chloroflexota bacterium]|nr:ATP-binding protein [Chloroflexota bacterium]